MTPMFDSTAVNNNNNNNGGGSMESSLLAESGTMCKHNDAPMSGTASLSDDGNLSCGEESFLEAIGVDFRNLAHSLRQTAGGVANFVQRSAMNVAAEIARLEQVDFDHNNDHDHQPRLIQQSNTADSLDRNSLRLPWEIFLDDDQTYVEDLILKDVILDVSLEAKNFLRPIELDTTASPPPEQQQQEFILDEPRIQLIRRLLEIDNNLAVIHARLSGRSDVRETVFWKNYFDHCEERKRKHLLQQQLQLEQQQEDEDLEQEHYDGIPRRIGSQNSLVRADSADTLGSFQSNEESSFVIPSPPMSGNSAAEVRSVDSLVFVDAVNSPGDVW